MSSLPEIQRLRILAAMVDIVAEEGLARATVARVVARSRVSRRTYYEIFADREQCFLAAVDHALARAGEFVLPGYDNGGRWRERIRGGLVGLLSFAHHEPSLGKLLIVDSLAATRPALQRRALLLARIAAVVDEGRAEAKAPHRLSPVLAEGVVGGVLSVLHSRLLHPPPHALLELVGPLTGMVVLPYLGPAAAEREAALPAPHPLPPLGAAGPDPLRELPMRLTHRTVLVIAAVGDLGGRGSYPSNRQIGAAAGVSDQGQISKLLARLERLGLVENRGVGHSRGGANAWALTEAGLRVWEAVGTSEYTPTPNRLPLRASDASPPKGLARADRRPR